VAEAPGHRLGQIIGTTLEAALEPVLQEIADLYGLYLDKTGPRAARGGRKVTWTDSLGNAHDLDYVLERGGTETELGVPVAFIETAWRRYTKHSRNKAQEIQGAVLPLLVTHSESKPFAGAVLAGVFTAGSLEQLRSNGFVVLYIPYDEVVTAFSELGMDVEYNERTPDEHLARQIATYESLGDEEREALAKALRHTAPEQFHAFDEVLQGSLSRRVESITVVPLLGSPVERSTARDALRLVRTLAHSHQTAPGDLPLVRIEVSVRYSNGDQIIASFNDPPDAERFLASFE
jgi:hypothetical protein